MLVLARKVGERVIIADEIVVQVLNVSHDGKVRLAFSAPDDIRIDREEVHKLRQQQFEEEKERLRGATVATGNSGY